MTLPLDWHSEVGTVPDTKSRRQQMARAGHLQESFTTGKGIARDPIVHEGLE